MLVKWAVENNIALSKAIVRNIAMQLLKYYIDSLNIFVVDPDTS